MRELIYLVVDDWIVPDKHIRHALQDRLVYTDINEAKNEVSRRIHETGHRYSILTCEVTNVDMCRV